MDAGTGQLPCKGGGGGGESGERGGVGGGGSSRRSGIEYPCQRNFAKSSGTPGLHFCSLLDSEEAFPAGSSL